MQVIRHESHMDRVLLEETFPVFYTVHEILTA
jgi:hypothetical protein